MSNDTARELLPCPFCGGPAIYKYQPDMMGLGWHNVLCEACIVSVGKYAHNSNAACAIAAWNRRAQPAGAEVSEGEVWKAMQAFMAHPKGGTAAMRAAVMAVVKGRRM